MDDVKIVWHFNNEQIFLLNKFYNTKNYYILSLFADSSFISLTLIKYKNNRIVYFHFLPSKLVTDSLYCIIL